MNAILLLATVAYNVCLFWSRSFTCSAISFHTQKGFSCSRSSKLRSSILSYKKGTWRESERLKEDVRARAPPYGKCHWIDWRLNVRIDVCPKNEGCCQWGKCDKTRRTRKRRRYTGIGEGGQRQQRLGWLTLNDDQSQAGVTVVTVTRIRSGNSRRSRSPESTPEFPIHECSQIGSFFGSRFRETGKPPKTSGNRRKLKWQIADEPE